VPFAAKWSPVRGCKTMRTAVGGRLSDAQRQAVEAICGSGRGAEIVVGVAGSGKTTMLNVVKGAFEAAGCQVIGTATSGQAAGNLGVRRILTTAGLSRR
jgi:ABC-type branched-subunit amino acid transport system ATPase component